MLRTSFKIGLTFIDGQIRRQIRRRLPTGKIQLEDDNGELVNLTDDELRRYWFSGEWVIDDSALHSLKDALYLAVPRDLGTYPERHQQEALRRQRYIQAINPETTPYNPAVWRAAIEEAARSMEDRYPPCPATVQAWWRRYRNLKSINCLIPHNKPSCGPKAKKRYGIFEDAIAKVYLTKQKLPKLAVVEEVYRQIEAINNGRPSEPPIKKPSRSTIYRWLDDLHQNLVDASREGAEAARMKYRAAIGSVKVGSVLERIEIDHTPIDLIGYESSLDSTFGRPWLTVAIDVYSRMVVGFYISFNAPSSYSVLQCLRQAILPKDEWLARFPDIKGRWPAYGIPDLIAVDNGTDLHSDALEKTCLEMGIQILFCGAKTPQHKGVVERFFRTMNMGLIHRLPGTVFSNVKARGDYPAEEKAAIDLETLVHLLTKWLVDVYHVTPHRGIGARPLDRWLESAEGRIIELPVYPQQLEVMTGIPAKRTLFHYGVELEGLTYNSELLQSIRRRAGENKPVTLKFYEDAAAYVDVFDPYAKEYIRVPCKLAEYAENLTRHTHRLIRANARKRFGDDYEDSKLLESRAEIEALIKQALRDKRMGSRKIGASFLMHDSESVLKGGDPLKEARRPIRERRSQPPSELAPGLDDDLPDFDLSAEEE